MTHEYQSTEERSWYARALIVPRSLKQGLSCSRDLRYPISLERTSSEYSDERDYVSYTPSPPRLNRSPPTNQDPMPQVPTPI